MKDIVWSQVWSTLSTGAERIVFALLIYFIGKWLIKFILKLIKKGKFYEKQNPTVQSFFTSFLKIGLYVLMIISIINVLGVPIASIVAVLASAGVAVGLALQGALGNLAGGLMLMVFRPFDVGDYISASGAEGTVREVALFYTVIITADNKKVTIPNGTLMNANVVNFSSEGKRRIELIFHCGRENDPVRVQETMLACVKSQDRILKEEEMFARISGASSDGAEYTVRAWTKVEDYWDVYYDLEQEISQRLITEGISGPETHVVTRPVPSEQVGVQKQPGQHPDVCDG